MELIQRFDGTVNRSFQGKLSYRFHLPPDLSALLVILTYDQERISDTEAYLRTYRAELLPILEGYEKQWVSHRELSEKVAAMKTELQPEIRINNIFAGNTHRPGRKKELFLSENQVSPGCPHCPPLSGVITIIVNVFQVVEDCTSFHLEVKGEFKNVETGGAA